MIDIKEAIEQSKVKDNVSNGGSKCFDFGDTVLVKYICPIKYLYNSERTRETEEIVMAGVNKLADKGVNTPRHIAIERYTENGNDICYVLQEKSKGINCAEIAKYGVSFDAMCDSLEFVLNIPFEHYKKLVSDCYEVFELEHEAKPKNIFYDKDTGFWLIDFLGNDKENKYCSDELLKIFYTIKYKLPNLVNIASTVSYNSTLTPEQIEKQNLLENSIRAKLFLAMKAVFPELNKYEKFYLYEQEEQFKKYLMNEKIVDIDLFNLTEEDYLTYEYLYEKVLNFIVNDISQGKDSFENVKVNTIRNEANIYNLARMWKIHKNNPVVIKDEEDISYDLSSEREFTNRFLIDIKNKLETMTLNEHIEKFLNDMNASLNQKTR